MKLINKKQTGFTLIELIIVIVILGILAVTAAPKFLDLQTDAKKSTLQGVDGSINGALGIVYGKAVIAGIQKVNKTDASAPKIGDIEISFGYPEQTAAGLLNAIDLSVGAGGDFNGTVITSLEYVISTKGSTVAAGLTPTVSNGTAGEAEDGCYVSYKEAADADTPPVIIVNTDDC